MLGLAGTLVSGCKIVIHKKIFSVDCFRPKKKKGLMQKQYQSM